MASKVDDPNPPDATTGITPLQLATQRGHSDIVKFLTSIIYPWYHYLGRWVGQLFFS